MASVLRLALRIVVNAVSLWVAAELIDGIDLAEGIGSILFVAIVFGIVNAVIKPAAKLLALPITLLTLGLFTVVVNAAMLALTGWLTDSLDVEGFWPAVFGAIVVSVVSWVLSVFVPDDED